ncbi:MAG: hypothetical protein AB7I36_17485 [Rhodospirillaceae bacterium]
MREVIALGADWVKLFASTGGTQSPTGEATLTVEEIKAAVEIAHPLGKKNRGAVIWAGRRQARRHRRGDTIEHAIDIDDETLAMMKARGITPPRDRRRVP